MLVVFIGVAVKSRDSRRLLTDASPLRGWVEEQGLRCAHRLLNVLRPYGAGFGAKIMIYSVFLVISVQKRLFLCRYRVLSLLDC